MATGTSNMLFPGLFTGSINFETYMTLFEFLAQVVRVWADQVGGGVKTLCIKIGYSEPTRAESREGSSPRAGSSRVT